MGKIKIMRPQGYSPARNAYKQYLERHCPDKAMEIGRRKPYYLDRKVDKNGSRCI